jgi:hypothetical protein
MDLKHDVLEFRVTLREVEPVVWRQVEVPAKYTFWDLHVAIQDAMGWLDYHVHMFRVADARGDVVEIGIPDDELLDDDPVCLAGWKVPIAAYFYRVGARAEYEYDFGDGWLHELRLERISPRQPPTKYPRCTDGANRCPPEDCGGPHGYAGLLDVIADPSHDQYASTLEWLGGPIDPTEFASETVRFDSPAKRWRNAFTERR